jgi:hypothetical protein
VLPVQAPHVRFTDAEGVLLTRVPGAHVAHAVQLALSVPVLYSPAAHAAQVRFTVAEGVLLTYVPAAHVRQAPQVAALVVAL